MIMYFFFFFSSRRRHTRFSRDWSSDVCSSDLEIESADYPGERLVVCRNPLVAAERARKREDLLRATEAALAPIKQRVEAGTLVEAAAIALAVGQVINRRKVKKHLELEIADGHFAYRRKQAQIDEEAALDGFYVLRTNLAAQTRATPAVLR